MQSPDPFPPIEPEVPARRRLLRPGVVARTGGGYWLLGERLARWAGLVLVLLTSALLLLGFSVWNEVERLFGL